MAKIKVWKWIEWTERTYTECATKEQAYDIGTEFVEDGFNVQIEYADGRKSNVYYGRLAV